ncbi:MAG: HD domain-containing protein [Anaerolineales bacterium]|nr:HD domain-containing protein [Anaerolineales bacterium]
MTQNQTSAIDPSLYPNRWIAIIKDQVIGVGLTPEQAFRAAKRTRPKEKPSLLYVDSEGQVTLPQANAADWLNRHPLLRETIALLQRQGVEAYLVGGAVRDLLLGRNEVIDFDFVVPDNGLGVARRVANGLKAAFYPLDAQRGTGRVVCDTPDGKIYLDFASFRGPDLETDLADRDFTINAIAISLTDPPQLIDPLAGQDDLRQQAIRAAAPDAFSHDPARVLRAVRQATEFDFRVTPDTETYLRQAIPQLNNVSPERQRDELVKLLNTPAPGRAVRMLHNYGVLSPLLPEVEAMVGVTQSAPHYQTVFEHTLAALDTWPVDAEGLGIPDPLADKTRRYLNTEVSGNLSIAALMPLALLLHDTGKPLTRTEETAAGATKIRFLGHARESAHLARQIMNRFRFSSQATDFVTNVVLHHMRPLMLAAEGQLSRRAIYRFFRDSSSPTCPAGVAIALHALIDHQATYPPGQGQTEGEQLREVAIRLLTAYFEAQDQVVDPPPLLNGRDLMDIFGLKEGRLIGLLLGNLKEAQAAGEVADRAAAIDFIKADPNFAHQQRKDL